MTSRVLKNYIEQLVLYKYNEAIPNNSTRIYGFIS